MFVILAMANSENSLHDTVSYGFIIARMEIQRDGRERAFIFHRIKLLRATLVEPHLGCASIIRALVC